MSDNNILLRILFILLPWVAVAASAQEEYDDGDEAAADTLTAETVAGDSAADDPAAAWPENVRQRLGRLLESSIFDTSTVGIEVYDLTADSAIFRYNERQLMRPASTMKMITAVAALDRLGGSYQFKTRLSYTGSIDSCVLRGSLYCKGGMDPLFNGDDLGAFVESIRKMGVDTIKGNIYADLSMKDSDLLGEGWCWDDDNPVLSPLLISGRNRFMERFCSRLREAGIVLAGDTLTGTTPKGAYEICTRFHTIDQILMRMMKKSDNLYAEAMFFQLAAASGASRATAGNGRQMVNRLIAKLGMRPRDYYVADGSGLSLYNYVSPELEVCFLRYAYSNENIYVHLLPSMPVAGVDGTLAKRMRSGFAHGNVRAKTGTVTGVSSLAGYCTAVNGHVLCFSIINMGIRSASTGRNFQDRVCEALCRP